MKTDVTGGHSETQSRSCLCRRSLCKWASLHKPSKVTVWFGAPSLEEPDNEVQFVRLFVCTTNLAWPHTGGGRGTQTGMPWWVVCAILLYHILIFHLHSGPLFFYSYLPGNTKLALTQKLLFAPIVLLKGVARWAWKTDLKDTLLTLTLFRPLNVLCKDCLIGRTTGVQNPKCTFSGSQT